MVVRKGFFAIRTSRETNTRKLAEAIKRRMEQKGFSVRITRIRSRGGFNFRITGIQEGARKRKIMRVKRRKKK